MIQGINREYISQAINELVRVFAIKEDVEYDNLYQFCDLPPIAVPPINSKLDSLSPLERVVYNQASYKVGCDYTPVSIVQSIPSLLLAS